MKKKILFLINDLKGGGAEKILLDTVKEIDHNKYEINVCTIFNDGIYDMQIKEYCDAFLNIYNIKIFPKSLRKYIKSFLLRRIKYFNTKQLLCNFLSYDIMIAYLEGPSTKIIAECKKNCKKIAWVHIDPIALPYSTKYFKNLEQEIKCYKNFDNILCVSSDVKKSFIAKYGSFKNVNVLLNLLDNDKVYKKSLETLTDDFISMDKFTIISVGRLAEQKSFIRLLEAVNELHKSYKNIQLLILGEGPDRRQLENYINLNNMKPYVKLYGFIENPYPLMKKSNLFVCSSITEGFSTVVCEAILLGLPVVTTDCSGMHDILGDSKYGLIVENSTNGLINGINHILEDRNYYNALQLKSKERASFFNKENRVKELELILDKM